MPMRVTTALLFALCLLAVVGFPKFGLFGNGYSVTCSALIMIGILLAMIMLGYA